MEHLETARHPPSSRRIASKGPAPRVSGPLSVHLCRDVCRRGFQSLSLSCALGPSGTALGNMQARLIFSRHSKYCPLYFNTGNPVTSWEQGLPRNSVPWGRGEGGACLLNIFSSVLAKSELLVLWVSGAFPFKDIGAAEICSSPSSSHSASFPHV